MKFHFDVDCTPDEARAFFGLPDVKPLQEAMMKEAQERMSAAMNINDPETLMKLWMPSSVQGFEQFQKFFANPWAKASSSGE